MKKVIILALTVMLSGCFGGGSNTNSGSGSDANGDNANTKTTSSSGDIIKRADGSVIKLGGYKAAAPKADAKMYSASYKAGELPSKVDLRKYMTNVESQGELGSCAANAAAGAYEYLLNRVQGINNYDVSRLFLYYNTRAIMGTINEDSGSLLDCVLQTLNKDGICNENTWPYDIRRFRQKPNQQSYDEALKNKISSYECIPLNLDAWKSVLAEGYPIIFGLQIYSSFMNPRNGRIPMPGRNDVAEGGHAMCCVGYSDPDRVFIVRNSWGHQWGDGGYCYIPYDYMINSKYNGGDSWVIYDVNPIKEQDVEETWSDDSESLFVDMENEFSDMSDEDWEAMCEELGDCDIVFRLGALYNIACWGDEEMAPEEAKMAVEKLKKILQMFGLDYSPKKVFKYCENIWVEEDDDFFEKTVEILSKYLSEGARATIAADMLEICNADDDASDDERDIILGIVGDWLNDELIEAYYDDYYDEEYDDEYDYYDDEDDYYYDDDDEDYDDYDEY